MTLALLLTAATSAWAESKPIGLNVEYAAGDKITSTTDVYVYHDEGQVIKITSATPASIRRIAGIEVSFNEGSEYEVIYQNPADDPGGTKIAMFIKCVGESTGDATVVHVASGSGTLADPYVFTPGPGSSGNAFPITWSASSPNTASIEAMPAGNVTVNVKYFAQAELATSTGETPELLAPAAIDGVAANTDDPILTAGTVANIGTSEVKQGTLKYLVKQADGNTAPDAPDYDDEGWSENVPTANGRAEGKAYVWYYIKGAEPANIADRTDDNTRSDSDIKPLGTNGFVTLDPEPTYYVSLNKTGMAEGEPAKWSAKSTNVAEVILGTKDLEGVKKSETVTVTYSGTKKIIGVKAEKTVPFRTLADATTADVGMVVCAAGHLHEAMTPVPDGCTAVGVLGKVTDSGGHGLILALKDAATESLEDDDTWSWNTINGWTSVDTYAGTTLKQLPSDALGTNLKSYDKLGKTTVSNWCVAQKSDYEAIFTNLDSATGDSDGMTFDDNVNAYITGAGGEAISSNNYYWSATEFDRDRSSGWIFISEYWTGADKVVLDSLRPVLGF